MPGLAAKAGPGRDREALCAEPPPHCRRRHAEFVPDDARQVRLIGEAEVGGEPRQACFPLGDTLERETHSEPKTESGSSARKAFDDLFK